MKFKPKVVASTNASLLRFSNDREYTLPCGLDFPVEKGCKTVHDEHLAVCCVTTLF
jgi:hypothetical protein